MWVHFTGNCLAKDILNNNFIGNVPAVSPNNNNSISSPPLAYRVHVPRWQVVYKMHELAVEKLIWPLWLIVRILLAEVVKL